MNEEEHVKYYDDVTQVLDSWKGFRALNPTNPSKYASVKFALKEGWLLQTFRHDYPETIDKRIHFIPNVHKIDHPDEFLHRDCRQESSRSDQLKGVDHEHLMHKHFQNLNLDRDIYIFRGYKNEKLINQINKKDIKDQLNREFDMIVCDNKYGIFIIEIKKSNCKEYVNFDKTPKSFRVDRQDVKDQIDRQRFRKLFVSCVRNYFS